MHDSKLYYLKKVNKDFSDIIYGDTKIGKIGLSRYNDIKALGIGSFEIHKAHRRKGHGYKFLKYLISQNKDKYDLIYCYVNKDNKPAINLYKKIGWVGSKVVNHEPKSGKGQYMVELYKKRGYKY